MLDVSSSLAPGTAGGPGQWGLARERAGDAHKDGFATVIRAGPFGDRPGTSKRVRVRFLDPGHRGEVMTVAPRRAATGSRAPCSRCSTRTSASPSRDTSHPAGWQALPATPRRRGSHPQQGDPAPRGHSNDPGPAGTRRRRPHQPCPGTRAQQRRPARPRCRDGQAAAHDRPAIPGPTQTAPAVPRPAGAHVRIRCRAAFEWVPPRVGLSLDGTVALCRDGTTQQCPSGASHLRGAPLADLHAVRRARSLVRRAFAGLPRAFAPGAAGNTAAWG